MPSPRDRLAARQDFRADPPARGAFYALMRDVFSIDLAAREVLAGPDTSTRAFALFDPSGACVAGLDIVALPLCLKGTVRAVAAVCLVAVAPSWRGQGLFRTVMAEALAWIDATGRGPALLYAAESALYERFGFRDMPQHRHVGAPPPAAPGSADARRLSLLRGDDVALLRRLLATRAPVSNRVGVAGGASLFLAQAGEFHLDHCPGLDAIVASQKHRDGTFVLADVVAARIPPLAAVLAALDRAPRLVHTLFVPDKLAWAGEPVRNDTGLMIRGASPAAFAAPFMLPPTASF